MKAEDTYLHIYKQCKNGKETWTVYWEQDDFFGAYYHDGFPTYYDAEHYARTISYNKAYTSNIEDYFDEMGREVYTRRQARYQLKHPEAHHWENYKKDLAWNKKTDKQWKKWWMKPLKLFFKPHYMEAKKPEYEVYDLKNHIVLWSGVDPREGISYVRNLHKTNNVFHLDDDVHLVAKE